MVSSIHSKICTTQYAVKIVEVCVHNTRGESESVPYVFNYPGQRKPYLVYQLTFIQLEAKATVYIW